MADSGITGTLAVSCRARGAPPRVRVRFRTPGEVLWRLGETLNRGWLVTSPRFPVRIGYPVEVEFKLPGANASIRTRGEVLAVAEGAPERENLAFVGFESLTPESKKRIDEIVVAYRKPLRAKGERSLVASVPRPVRISH